MSDNPDRNAWGSMLPATPPTDHDALRDAVLTRAATLRAGGINDRRSGPTDRRTTSAAGDRLRARAVAFHALADVNADHQQDAESDYMSGYAEGAASAYRAAAQMIEQLANEEDAR